MMETVSTPEMSVSFYETTWRTIAEDISILAALRILKLTVPNNDNSYHWWFLGEDLDYSCILLT
jgi:hypothetical protein